MDKITQTPRTLSIGSISLTYNKLPKSPQQLDFCVFFQTSQIQNDKRLASLVPWPFNGPCQSKILSQGPFQLAFHSTMIHNPF